MLSKEYTRSVRSIIKMMKVRYKNLVTEDCQDDCETYFLSISPNETKTNSVHFVDDNTFQAVKSIQECSVRGLRISIIDLNIELTKECICICDLCSKNNIKVYLPPVSKRDFVLKFYNGTYEQQITVLKDLLRKINGILEKLDYLGVDISLGKGT